MAAIFNYSSTYTKQSYMFKKFARNERVSDASKTIDSSFDSFDTESMSSQFSNDVFTCLRMVAQ